MAVVGHSYGSRGALIAALAGPTHHQVNPVIEQFLDRTDGGQYDSSTSTVGRTR